MDIKEEMDETSNETTIRVVVLSKDLVAQAVAADIIEQAFRQHKISNIEHTDSGIGNCVERAYFLQHDEEYQPATILDMVAKAAPHLFDAKVIIDDFYQGPMPVPKEVSPAGLLTQTDETYYRFRELKKILEQNGASVSMIVKTVTD